MSDTRSYCLYCQADNINHGDKQKVICASCGKIYSQFMTPPNGVSDDYVGTYPGGSSTYKDVKPNKYRNAY